MRVGGSARLGRAASQPSEERTKAESRVLSANRTALRTINDFMPSGEVKISWCSSHGKVNRGNSDGPDEIPAARSRSKWKLSSLSRLECSKQISVAFQELSGDAIQRNTFIICICNACRSDFMHTYASEFAETMREQIPAPAARRDHNKHPTHSLRSTASITDSRHANIYLDSPPNP